jgi:site-specific recombinase XerD
VPAIVATAGRQASRRFLEFFAATIRNPNTREAYARAVRSFFEWCSARGYSELHQLEPMTVAAYVEQLGNTQSKPTVKQHLAAIRMLFDWLVVGQVLPTNPASAVRGPTHVVKRGKTPVLSPEDARRLLDSIDTTTLVGLRDRALIGAMVYSFARVSAVVGMLVEDYYPEGKRWWLRLHEKGGKLHQVPAHHVVEEYLDSYLKGSGIRDGRRTPLFRTLDRSGSLTANAMTRNDVFRMVKRRARAAGISADTCCHTFRATGITAYLDNGGTIENAQAIAAHESPRTTKLYDRTNDEITLDEIERIIL